MNTHSTVTEKRENSHKRLITASNESEAKAHAKSYCNEYWTVSVFYKTLGGNQWAAKYISTEGGE